MVTVKQSHVLRSIQRGSSLTRVSGSAETLISELGALEGSLGALWGILESRGSGNLTVRNVCQILSAVLHTVKYGIDNRTVLYIRSVLLLLQNSLLDAKAC